MTASRTTSANAIDRRVIPDGARESQWEAADGAKIRRIDWQPQAEGTGTQPRGSILFMPGRGDHYEKYLETLDEWARAGWHVTASDWRGQGTSGRLGKDGLTGHIDDFGTWTADLAVLWTEPANSLNAATVSSSVAAVFSVLTDKASEEVEISTAAGNWGQLLRYAKEGRNDIHNFSHSSEIKLYII